jgi:hypothetical protein
VGSHISGRRIRLFGGRFPIALGLVVPDDPDVHRGILESVKKSHRRRHVVPVVCQLDEIPRQSIDELGENVRYESRSALGHRQRLVPIQAAGGADGAQVNVCSEVALVVDARTQILEGVCLPGASSAVQDLMIAGAWEHEQRANIHERLDEDGGIALLGASLKAQEGAIHGAQHVPDTLVR